MRAGQLRHRISIQTPVTAKNTRGGEVTTWSTVATVWADVRTQTGRETVANDQTQPTASHVVTMRHRANVTAQQRIVWGDRVFSINAVLEPDNRMRQLQLLCQELVGTDRGL